MLSSQKERSPEIPPEAISRAVSYPPQHTRAHSPGSRMNGGENTHDSSSVLASVRRDPAGGIGGLYRVCSSEAPRRPGSPVAGPPAVSEEFRGGRQGKESGRYLRQGWNGERASGFRDL